jgi:hypothetical protein
MIHRVGISTLFLLAAASCLTAQEPLPASRPASRPSGEYVDAVAAKVNRTVITKSQVDRQIGSAARGMPAADYDIYYRRKLLELAFGAIEQDAVERVGLVVPKRYILEQVEQQKEKKGAAEIAEGIREAGYKSEEEYVEALGKNISRETYVAAQSGQLASKAPQFRPDYWTEPTATEIRRYYRLHIGDEFTQKNQARLFAIFLPFKDFAVSKDDPASGKVRVKEVADTIREELAKGTDFGTLARRFGRELKADEGGDLGWVAAESSYQKTLVEFALKGPLKELSEPMPYPTAESPRGIVVAWVAERVEQRVMPFEEAQTKIRDRIRGEHVEAARKKIIQKMVDEAFISPPDVKRDLLRYYSQSQ